jgi:hypothetical protein
MRLLILLLLVTATSGISAQQLLFDKTIPEQNVPETSRLRSEMRSHYISSRYVSQTDFLSPQDFFIAISSNLIVKSKFVKMHNYPSRSVSYEGKLEGPVTGQVTFSKYNDRIAGLILLNDGTKYIIDQVAPGIFTVSLSNESAFIQKEKQADFIEVSGQTQPNASVTSVCDLGACPGSSTIDIMVVYTPQAENSWGGQANTVANITQAITNMNTSVSNSGISNVTFRLVHTAKISYAESGDFGTDLTRLSGISDGYMDNVHSLRDQYGADLVSLVIGSPTSSCGMGYLNTNPSAYSSGNAFNVSLYSCVIGNFTLAHENGHNMGLRHDWYVDASTSPCSHHHGYVNEVALSQGTSSPASSRWRTIMAYNDRCAVAGFNCTRVNIWSNPNVAYNGDAAGKATGSAEPSDEAYAFHRMACLVAAFRPDASAAGGGGGAATCDAPSGLNMSNITTSSSTANWSPVSGAISYDVDYKASSSGTWITIAFGTTSTSWGFAGMSASTTYDWRVRTNCTSGSSGYTQSQFSTQGLTSCNAPSGLSTLSITTSSATASWSPVSGANSYNVDYKSSSSGSWINIASGITSTSWNLAAMSPATNYDWRVRANCSSGSSSYTQTQFTTQGLTSCNAPSGLSTLSITTSSATASWSPVSGATSYNVDYKASSSGSWINIASGITSTSWNLLGMPAATSFDWRVRANCSSGSSGYAQTTFSTLSQFESCSSPTGLSTSNITASAATASWAPVSGAASYNVDYKPVSSTSWITIANGTSSLSWTLLGMEANTSYDWRVRANCSSGNSSYTQTQFTTQGLGSCNAPGGLFTSGITSNSATLNWNPVSGAIVYTAEYKPTSSGTWIIATSGTYGTSVNLYSLSANTTYDWRVKTNCSLTESSNYSTAQFTASGSTPPPTSPGCPGPYDVSTNGSIGGAALVPLSTDVNGTVSTRGDIDHYKFTVSSGGTVTVSLSTLPANYNLAVLNSSGTQIAISENNGPQTETISLNLAAGQYYAKVFPKGNAYSATSCYTLRVQNVTATDAIVKNNLALNLFPNPTEGQLNVWIEGMNDKAKIRVYDITGKLVMQQPAVNTLTQLNVARLSAGVYMINVNDGVRTKSAKFVKK